MNHEKINQNHDSEPTGYDDLKDVPFNGNKTNKILDTEDHNDINKLPTIEDFNDINKINNTLEKMGVDQRILNNKRVSSELNGLISGYIDDSKLRNTNIETSENNITIGFNNNADPENKKKALRFIVGDKGSLTVIESSISKEERSIESKDLPGYNGTARVGDQVKVVSGESCNITTSYNAFEGGAVQMKIRQVYMYNKDAIDRINSVTSNSLVADEVQVEATINLDDQGAEMSREVSRSSSKFGKNILAGMNDQFYKRLDSAQVYMPELKQESRYFMRRQDKDTMTVENIDFNDESNSFKEENVRINNEHGTDKLFINSAAFNLFKNKNSENSQAE